MRRLYYRESYGRIHRDRQAEQRIPSSSGMPARFFVTVLMVLAGIVVIASLIDCCQLPRQACLMTLTCQILPGSYKVS
jgi:hypothetical protein